LHTCCGKEGKGVIDDFSNELKEQKRLKSRSDYTKLKAELSQMLVAPKGEQSDLIKELETAIFEIARDAQ
jgi:hypothetical protein